jgi:geranylgeranyl pyrophosphate synthase
MLYQIVDDIIGIWGETEDTGKQALADVRRRKASLPLLYGFQEAPEVFRELIAPRVEVTPVQSEQIRDELARRGILERCKEHVEGYRDRALAGLRETGNDSPEIMMLTTMTELCSRVALDLGGAP